jgi:hypothetical protein
MPAHNTRYKTLGFKWLCKQHLSHQSLLYLDSEVLRTPQRIHTAIRQPVQKPLPFVNNTTLENPINMLVFINLPL